MFTHSFSRYDTRGTYHLTNLTHPLTKHKTSQKKKNCVNITYIHSKFRAYITTFFVHKSLRALFRFVPKFPYVFVLYSVLYKNFAQFLLFCLTLSRPLTHNFLLFFTCCSISLLGDRLDVSTKDLVHSLHWCDVFSVVRVPS
uniref:Uncharacterized protein n=1 Tax=Cacopsylla melanoneura TaxID=428564 RepID=A0A8D8UKW9_9HEMI